MQTSTETLEGHVVRMTVTVPAEFVDAAVKATYKQMAEEMKIPGFRKGHVPPKVIDNYIGRDQVFAQVQENVIGEVYGSAIDDAGLRPIDQPDFGELELPAEGADYTFSADVPVRPELTLGDYSGISISAPSDAISDEDVQEEIDKIRDRFATLETVDGRGIGENDFALISFTGLVAGEEYEGNTVEKFLYEMGAGQMPDEFEEALLGAKAGDTLEAAFLVPESSFRKEMVGKEATFDIEVHEVKEKILPEVDDEFAQGAGFEDAETMTQQLTERVQTGATFARLRAMEIEAQEKLASALEGEIPEAMVNRRTDEIIRDFFNSLENQGITPEQYTASRDMQLQDLEEEFGKEAIRSLSAEMALEALFRDQGMEITDEDIDAELTMVGGEDSDIAEMRERFEQAGIMPALNEQIMQRKATEWLMEEVEVVEAERSDDSAESSESKEEE